MPTMEDYKTVYSSNITRVEYTEKKHLYDLLTIEPVAPVRSKGSENETSFFRPLADKYYAPMKTSRLKVRTVREIRSLFEQDNYTCIMEDIEKQRNLLFTKIKSGYANDERTKSLATKILDADNPISRTSWQMIKNINPWKHSNTTQFVLWNGNRIKVTGSKGGRNRFICSYDLGKKNSNSNQPLLRNCIKKHCGLLRNSLNIKFKPGPLRRKKNLDNSHQKYHMGPIELIKVPKPALNIQPAYGTALEPNITSYLNSFRAEDGVITKTWAEFAVSVLGTVKNKNLVHIDKDSSITFDLKYKCDQSRILMRRDINRSYTGDLKNTSVIMSSQRESDCMLEIKDIVDKMVTSVEISLKQDCMYSIDNQQLITNPNTKDKCKKRNCELDRLDVTVIQLPGIPKCNLLKPCEKPYCNLGCICDSLECKYKLKQHCGSIECMFGCKCKLPKYKALEVLENGSAELIPGLMKLDNEINNTLAKEEQKFHQTVVVSGEKSIVLKSTKRNLKSSRKYADFYSSLRLQSEKVHKKILTVMVKKLNCSNIEPLCMVHNLYKCFCKGKFLETSRINSKVPSTDEVIVIDELNSAVSSDVDIEDTDIRNKISLRPRAGLSTCITEKTKRSVEKSTIRDSDLFGKPGTSARTTGYFGRKYEDSYYKHTHFRMLQMEQNDKTLHNKMVKLKNNALFGISSLELTDCTQIEEEEDATEDSTNGTNGDNINIEENQLTTELNKTMQPETIENIITKSGDVKIFSSNKCEESSNLQNITEPHAPFNISSNIYKPVYGTIMKREFLARWMALGYKHFKDRFIKKRTTMEIPKKGRIILHPWEFLLKRYRDRKNIFMVSKTQPFRIFMAKEVTNIFFENCINIDTIRFADLYKYPFYVKNLLTNATSEAHFCILGGWEFCWEIVGSVKCRDPSILSSTENSSEDSISLDEENWNIKDDDYTEYVTSNNNEKLFVEINKNESEVTISERSKWFLMILENDFSEIHCHRKGFYVKRENVLATIDLARMTHKTIVINKQPDTENDNIPFGIYAIPNTKDYRVFVGPYEINEALGLELLKTNSIVTQNNTRGVWITTNKIDNVKILDDPLSFIKQKTNQDVPSKMIPVGMGNTAQTLNNINSQPSTNKRLEKVQNKGCSLMGPVVNPIKIRRVNGFYQLSEKKSSFKSQKLSPSMEEKPKDEDFSKNPNSISNPNSLLVNSVDSDVRLEENNVGSLFSDIIVRNEAVADDLSQLKITSIYSENNNETESKHNEEKRPTMFILKPEEINKRLSDCKLVEQTDDYKDVNEMEMDIETFLTTPRACSLPENDVVFISDDEEANKETKRTRTKKNAKKSRILNSRATPKRKITSGKGLPEPSATKMVKIRKQRVVSNCKKPQPLEVPQNVLNMKNNVMEGLEETSKLLENESFLLWNETEKRQNEIIGTLSVPEELKSELTETLQGLKSLNDHLMDD